MTHVTLTTLTPANASAVAAFHARAVLHSFAGVYADNVLQDWASSRDPARYLRNQENGENFLVAEISGQPVGFIGWKKGELVAIYVDPDYQRHAIGSQLINAADARATAAGKPITFVNASTSARGFYEKHGFQFVSNGTFTVCGHTLPDIRMERPQT